VVGPGELVARWAVSTNGIVIIPVIRDGAVAISVITNGAVVITEPVITNGAIVPNVLIIPHGTVRIARAVGTIGPAPTACGHPDGSAGRRPLLSQGAPPGKWI